MNCDVLVVGAGILGLSTAYHLKLANPGKHVVVVDRLGSPAQGNSAKSEGGFRNIFTSETNFLLADSTIDWMLHLERELGYHVGVSMIGYLFLLSEEQYSGQREAWDRIAGWGVEMRVLDREELEECIPGLVTRFGEDEESELLGLRDVDYGVLGIKCGAVDADALTRAYEELFLGLGGEVRYGTEVTGLILKPTVVAAGVWSSSLMDPIGVHSHMRPKKRQILAFKDRRLEPLFHVEGLNEYGTIPLTVLPKSNVLFRPELSEESIWMACADDLGREFRLEDDPQAEEGYYTDDVYHVLSKYFPCFGDVRPMNSWAGQYAINGFDELPVVKSVPGMIYVGAASGSGIMKCDAIARIAAALYAGEEEAELFGGRRFRVSDLGIHHRRAERETLVI
jgi:glycine/D-amino acid oxidase-like deaminating enzyme